MVKFKYILVAALVVIIGIVVVRDLSQSDERRVRTQFDRLSEWVSKESGESVFTTSHKMKSIATLFADPCEFKADVISFTGSYTPEEVSRFTAQGRFYFSELSLKFYDLKIDFIEEGRANVTLTATLKGRTKGGEDVDATHEVVSLLTKVDDQWLFSQFEVIEVLKK